jgi:hypothetical protein
MWICPECNRQFINHNQPHSCGNFSIEKVFKKYPSAIFQLFKQIHNEVVSFGDMKVYPLKNGMMYSVNSTFLALKPHRNYLAVEFISSEKHDEFPVEKCVRISKTKYANILKIDSPEAIDKQLINWLNKAYIINHF